jgi:RimJ/RimL family protein N-acetyltransferase
MSTMRSAPNAFPETVDTERLHLRRWRPDDRDAHAAIWAEPDVWESLHAGEPGDPGEAAAESFDRHLHHWEQHGWGTWAAIEPASGKLAGWLGASHPTFIPDVAHEIEVGWTLRRSFWGRGLATEGARAAVEAASTQLAPPRLISLILPTNSRSIAVAERLGMSPAELVTHPDLGAELRVYELRSSSGASPHSVSSR